MTKRLLSLFVAAFMVMALIPMSAFAKEDKPISDSRDEQVVASWDFETDPIEDGWVFTDFDGDGSNWAWSADGTNFHSGTHSITSASYSTDPLTPDNWAQSPYIEVPAGGCTLSFWVKNYSETYPETFQVWYNFEGQVGEPLAQGVTVEGTTWTELTYQIPDSNGERVAVAIRHYGCTDMWKFFIDDVTVTADVEVTPTEPADPTAPPMDDYAIHEVCVNGYESPVAGELATDHVDLTVPADVHYDILHESWSPEWWDNNPDVDDEFFGTFVEGNPYSMCMAVVAEEGYYFADDCVFYVNGSDELVDYNYTAVDEDDNTFCYVRTISEVAAPAEVTPNVIDTIEINGFVEPAWGEHPFYDVTVPAGAPYTIDYTDWVWWSYDMDDGDVMIPSDTFGNDSYAYYQYFHILPAEGYTFAENVTVKINGDESIVENSGISNSNDYYWAYTIDYFVTEPAEPTEPPAEPTEPPAEPTEPPAEPTEPPASDLDAALNVPDGTLHFETSETYPWIVVEEGSRVFAQSGNAGAASSTSELTLALDLAEPQMIVFEFRAWGEGSNTFWDHCDFTVDGERVLYYGAYDNDWESYSLILPAGAHTLVWSYTKDSSVNPTGDCFALDNVELTEVPEFTVTFVDGLTNEILGSWNVAAGTVLDETAFPAVPEHEGYEFVGWSYNGDPVFEDTTITARFRDPNAPNATVILNVPEDHWGDGTGYQMLLDADATAYGTIIPTTGPLTSSGDAPASVYAEFEYKIPENADGSLNTSNMVNCAQVAIELPAGTYDWCITNPTPGDRMWIASEQGNVGGRADDYEFLAGYTYTFTVTLQGQNDAVDVEIDEGNTPTEPPVDPTPTPVPTDPTEPPVDPTPTPVPTDPGEQSLIAGYYFEVPFDQEGWTAVDSDGDGHNWIWSPDFNDNGYSYVGQGYAYEGDGFAVSESYLDSTGTSLDPDNWLISEGIDIPEGSASLSLYTCVNNTSYPDHIAVYVGLTPNPADMIVVIPERVVDVNYSDYLHLEADMTQFGGETVYIGIRHFNSYDLYQLWVDQVEVFGESGGPVDPEPIPIHEVYVNGWGTPVEGVAGIDHMFLETPSDAPYFLVYGGWRDETDQQQMWGEQHVFIAGHEYSEGCQIWAEEGYYFADDCVFYADGSQDILDLQWCYVDEAENYICYMNSLPVICESEGPGILWGDADGDGDVDSADVLLIMRSCMNLDVIDEAQLPVCDVNGDGRVDMADALLVQRYVLGLIPSLPV